MDMDDKADAKCRAQSEKAAENAAAFIILSLEMACNKWLCKVRVQRI